MTKPSWKNQSTKKVDLSIARSTSIAARDFGQV